MGGMVLETNMNEILTRIEDQTKLEKQEVSKTCATAVDENDEITLLVENKWVWLLYKGTLVVL